MNRDDIIRKFVENSNAIPQDLDKIYYDELMELLSTEQAKFKKFMKFDNENDLIDDNF